VIFVRLPAPPAVVEMEEEVGGGTGRRRAQRTRLRRPRVRRSKEVDAMHIDPASKSESSVARTLLSLIVRPTRAFVWETVMVPHVAFLLINDSPACDAVPWADGWQVPGRVTRTLDFSDRVWITCWRLTFTRRHQVPRPRTPSRRLGCRERYGWLQDGLVRLGLLALNQVVSVSFEGSRAINCSALKATTGKRQHEPHRSMLSARRGALMISPP
jgi:hypothetical protein